MGSREDALKKEQLLKNMNTYINAIDYSVDIDNLPKIQEKRAMFLLNFVNKHDAARKYAENLLKKAFSNGMDENIIDEFVNYANFLLDNEKDKEKNKENIYCAVKLIYECKYHTEWRNSYIYDEKFVELASIPIYLGFEFLDIVSGEFLLHILHGDKLIFRAKPITFFGDIVKANGEILIDNKVKLYQKIWEDDRFFDNKTSYCKQLIDIFNIDLSCYERKCLREFLNIFGYIQENVGRLHILKNFKLDMGTEKFTKIDAQQKRILFLKTLLLQQLDFKTICYMFYSQKYLRTLISDCRVVIELNKLAYQQSSDTRCKQLKEKFLKILKEMEDYKDIHKCDVNVEVKAKWSRQISFDDICISVWWKIFDKEMLAFLDIQRRALKLEMKKYTPEQKNTFFAMKPDRYIALDDWYKFFYNNKENLEWLFSNDKNELRKIWNIARKFLAYFYFKTSNGFANNLKFNNKILLEQIFSADNIFRNIDIITMMEMIIVAPNINVTKEWHDKNIKDENQNKTLKQMISNIEKYYSQSTIKWILQYFLIVRKSLLGINDDYDIFATMYEYYKDVIEKKDSPEKKEEGLLYYFKVQDRMSRQLMYHPYMTGEISNIFLAQYCCKQSACYQNCDYLFSGEKCNRFE